MSRSSEDLKQISVLNKDDEVRIFKRPKGVVGKNARNFHPKSSLHKVEQIINDFKDGNRNKARFWIDLTIEDKKQKVMIEYYALRDADGNYIGCLEASQNITEMQKLSGEKRLLE